MTLCLPTFGRKSSPTPLWVREVRGVWVGGVGLVSVQTMGRSRISNNFFTESSMFFFSTLWDLILVKPYVPKIDSQGHTQTESQGVGGLSGRRKE